MRGGQVFMESLLAHGVGCIFGNPGTTENSLLDRLIDYPQLTYYVALHEGVAVCAANFYAQASGKTGVVNLHVAPGLGNGIGMIYGALKANTPMLVTAGQQDTRMRLKDPLLSHDLVAMAKPVTKWSAEPHSADEIAPLLRRAFKIANDPPCGPVFVSLPVNVMEQETSIGPSVNAALKKASTPDPKGVSQLVEMLLTADHPAIIAGDGVAREGAHRELVRLAEQIGAPVFHEGLRAQISFPNQHPNHRGRVPFEASATRKLLHNFDLVLLAGGSFFEDVWFDDVSPFPAGAKIVQIELSHERLAYNFELDLGIVGTLGTTFDAVSNALEHEAPSDFLTSARTRNDRLSVETEAVRQATQKHLEELWDTSPISAARAMVEIAQVLPENAIVVDESITASLEVSTHFDYREPGDYYAGRGGGIGQGVAGAIGVQVAHPNRRVLAFSGDGSAMYSIQALWTAAHHKLPIVFVIVSNREYRVLKHNLDIYRHRFDAASNKPYPHMDLTKPTIGFPAMAEGMGVAGELVTDASEIAPAMERAFAANAPYLVEVVVAGKP